MSWLSDIIGSNPGPQTSTYSDPKDQSAYNFWAGTTGSAAFADAQVAEGNARKNFATEAIPLLPKAPSFTDIVGQLYQRKKSQQGALMSGSRGSTFLTGPLGDTSQAPIGTKTLLGS